MTPDEAIALVQKYGKDAQVRVDGYSTWQDAACVLAEELSNLRHALDACGRDYFLLEAKHVLDSSSLNDARQERDELRRRVADTALEFAQFLFAKGVIPYSQFDSLIAEFEANQIEGGE